MIMLAQEDQMMMTTKGKRTKRARPASGSVSGDESGRVDTSTSSTTTATNTDSGTSATMAATEEEEDMAHCLILLAQGGSKIHPQQHPPAVAAVSTARTAVATTAGGGIYVYECKTCNRCFPSFQALGGHRASHKKPKLPAEEKAAPLALTADDHQQHQEHAQLGDYAKNNEVEVGLSLQIACNSSNTMSASNKLKVHACAICGAEFSSGQALGGHMRRHRSVIAAGGVSPSAPPAPPRTLLSLDLNLPADEQEDHQQPQPQSPKFIFGSNDKTLVFAPSLVDCRY